jgi:hypothetical protein
MRHPQLLVWESDGRLASCLEATAKSKKWLLRRPRRLDSCLAFLGRSGPAAVALKIGRDLQRELTLLEQVCWFFPETAVVVVCDTDDPGLVGLAWDLGASYVLSAPWTPHELTDIVTSILDQRNSGHCNDRVASS